MEGIVFMKKHAYLIMAHHKIDMLEILINLIDDSRNDIYIHIDKKMCDVNLMRLASFVQKSEINFLKRHNVCWGGYSLIKAELKLYKKASESYCYE